MAMAYITTEHAPQAVGPYSQAVRVGDLLFCSGQISIDPSTNQVQSFDGDVGKQTELVLRNLSAVLTAGGSALGAVVKTTVYLKDMNEFAAMNAAYARAFGAHRPARACVEVAGLPKDVLVEIDAIAAIAE